MIERMHVEAAQRVLERAGALADGLANRAVACHGPIWPNSPTLLKSRSD